MATTKTEERKKPAQPKGPAKPKAEENGQETKKSIFEVDEEDEIGIDDFTEMLDEEKEQEGTPQSGVDDDEPEAQSTTDKEKKKQKGAKRHANGKTGYEITADLLVNGMDWLFAIVGAGVDGDAKISDYQASPKQKKYFIYLWKTQFEMMGKQASPITMIIVMTIAVYGINIGKAKYRNNKRKREEKKTQPPDTGPPTDTSQPPPEGAHKATDSDGKEIKFVPLETEAEEVEFEEVKEEKEA